MISIIAATDRNRVIGKDGQLPWHLPDDLQHFREKTLNKPIIMGRKTHESIGKPLDKRKNIVLTTQQTYNSDDCEIVHDVEEALNASGVSGEVMVIGGESIFREFLPRTDRLYLTVIHDQFEGDTFFPELQESEWYLSDAQFNSSSVNSKLNFTYYVLDREHTSDYQISDETMDRTPDFIRRSLREPEFASP